MGIVGALVITKWAVGLLKETSGILLDGSVDPAVGESIRSAVAADPDCRVADLHVWAIAPGHLAVILSVETAKPRTPGEIKAYLSGIGHLSHVNVEVRQPENKGA
jgi:Co/Zn/Cd efflux system component